MDERGALRVPVFELPFSSLASRAARDVYVAWSEQDAELRGVLRNLDAASRRRQVDDAILLPLVAKQLARWTDAVDVEAGCVDGVRTEVFTPSGGVAEGNAGRVLINLHGGGFGVGGGGAGGRLESIPIAALGCIKVVSVDYRMAPEHTFPAASEDVAVVYRSLLREHEPHDVGIYGSSAGGMLTAQVVAWLLEEGLPLPGAVGMLGGTGQAVDLGDSAHFDYHVYGELQMPPGGGLAAIPYFAGADVERPLAAPMLFPEVLAKFPPSLLVTSSRAMEMSSVIDAHNKLTLAGARSRLHVWDGLGHCFYLDADMPESREVETVVVDFFAGSLGR